MFYDKFEELRVKKGVSRQRACLACGFSRTAWNKWRDGAMPSVDGLQRFADYFGVTIDYLRGKENTPTGTSRRELTDEDIYGAFFKGSYSEKKLNKLKKMAKLIDDEDDEG